MSALSPVLRALDGDGLAFWCPGCNETHMIRHGPGQWGWNGSPDRPTFTPSILVRGVKRLTDEQHAAWQRGEALPEPVPTVCHSFVTDGRIQFLGDSTHALAGQTVDLPPWPQPQDFEG